MRARTLLANTSACLLVVLVAVLLLPVGAGCTLTCGDNNDCSGGDVCLFAPGSGCSARGHCGEHESCVPQDSPMILCSCTDPPVSVNPFCAPNDGIAERTTTGACPVSTVADAGDQ